MKKSAKENLYRAEEKKQTQLVNFHHQTHMYIISEQNFNLLPLLFFPVVYIYKHHID